MDTLIAAADASGMFDREFSIIVEIRLGA